MPWNLVLIAILKTIKTLGYDYFTLLATYTLSLNSYSIQRTKVLTKIGISKTNNNYILSKLYPIFIHDTNDIINFSV